MYTASSTFRRLAHSAAVVVVLACIEGGSADAQDPVRLPGVTVKASAPLPGPRLLTGIVVDTAGNTIAGAEVTIPELQRRLYSREDGTFRFDSIPRGDYSMRARKLGYAPQVREFSVDTAGGVAEFKLLPIPHALPPIVSSASRGGLSGVVGDTAFNPIPGAAVRALGGGMETLTDSMGTFFMPVHSGTYMVSIKKAGFADRLVSVTIPSDSGRRITAWLQPFSGERPKDQFWNLADFQHRLAWIPPGSMGGATFYTRDQLLKLNIEWIYDAVEMTCSKNKCAKAYDPKCTVVVNGGPGTSVLSTLTIDDVEAVEVYGGGPTSRPATGGARPVGRGATGGGVAISNSRNARADNHGMSCPQVFVWTR